TTLTSVKGKKNSLHSSKIAAMTQNSELDFWILYEDGMLQKIATESLEIIEQQEFLYKQNNAQPFDYELMVDSDDDLWIYIPSSERGIYSFNAKDKSHFQLRKGDTSGGLNSNIVT